MPVIFTTDDYGDIILFGDVAPAMRVPGHSPTAPGAIPAQRNAMEYAGVAGRRKNW
ncbi:MAG: hypothetical protein AB7I68_05940 [Porticoccaceae bacterium]